MKLLKYLYKSSFVWAVVFFLSLIPTFAGPPLSQPSFPDLTGRVVDQAHALSAKTIKSLETQLKNFDTQSGNQLVVVVLETLNGYPIADYGYQLGRHWGIGQKGKNNGVLFIVALKDREMRIEVGYGLEDILTDAKTKSIIEQIVIPKFKAGNINQGIEAGVKAIIHIWKGENAAAASSDDLSDIIISLGIVLIFLIFIIIFNRRGGGSWGGGSGSGPSGVGRGRYSSGFSGRGGSFGGGGSSGKW